MSDTRLTVPERRAALSLASLIGFRMLGLFMLLPVMASYGQALGGYTPFAAGLAMGIYGLTQALLQIPMGRLSDRYGRKPVIAAGLLLFAGGALVAAFSTHIYGVILGRAMQGAGAISAAVLAFAADLTPEHRRSKVMAVIGMTIGFSFMVAFAGGPGIAGLWGLQGVFAVTAGLALLGLLMLFTVVPAEPARAAHADGDADWGVFWGLFRNGQLLRLAASIACLHLVMTALFLVLPLKLSALDLPAARHGLLYLPTLLAGALLMVPLLILAEKRGRHRALMLVAVPALALALALVMQDSLVGITAALVLYFVAFNWLEASIPSWASRVVPASVKGSALGLYSSAQFLGAFVGGSGAGFLHQQFGADAVLLGSVAVCLLWWGLVWGLKQPVAWTEWQAPVDREDMAVLLSRFEAMDGISDVLFVPESGALKLRYDRRRYTSEEIAELVRSEDA